MDVPLQKALLDRVYDKRKAATLDLERQVRDCLAHGDRARVNLIVQQLCSLLTSSPHNVNARNGGLIGLAGIGIALGTEIAPYLEQIAKPVLACFTDPDSKIRYFACESFYNIAKVCKGEILVYFNEIFDALSKLAADSELSVKNGAELLDRLLKDIVCEAAPDYISQFQDVSLIRSHQEASDRISGGLAKLDLTTQHAHLLHSHSDAALNNKVFSLARFVPLLSERMYVLSPFARNYLVSWITVLDSVPDLQLVSYLPAFLDGLLKYLSDPNTDVRVATANVLADLLREIREAAEAFARRIEFEQHQQRQKDIMTARKASIQTPASADHDTFASDPSNESTPTGTSPVKRPKTPASRSQTATPELAKRSDAEQDQQHQISQDQQDVWVPGQEVRIDYAAIMEILINHIGYPDEEIQATTLQWIAEFLLVVKDIVVPFTPRLIPAILPSLAHHSPAIASAAHATNLNLYRVIQQLPVPSQPILSPPRPPSSDSVEGRDRPSRDKALTTTTSSPSTVQPLKTNIDKSISSSNSFPPPDTPRRAAAAAATTHSAISSSQKDVSVSPISPRNRSHTVTTEPDTISIIGGTNQQHGNPSQPQPQPDDVQGSSSIPNTPILGLTDQRSRYPTYMDPSEQDPFDYQTTVNALTLQLLDEHEETRVTALEWLLMLHHKCPKKILSMHDGTFPALLKTLSDPSEDVIRCDLRLLAQISSASEDSYFHAFMANLVSLFSTDRRLLETRGSLIIRQLCATLHTERIFPTLAEILEKDEDLEFASIMVQNLNVILITSPELADFRKRLRNLESRDGQMLFACLYRSWCHNAVAALSLCLLAHAYEHASNLLTIFAELEITVGLLIQIDKLVQLLESPIFTPLRLQLLEPEKHPYLFKCLYGLLMLLPQSSAFVTLRNRLNAVNGLGFLHAVPRSSYAQTIRPSNSSTKSSGSRDEIKWSDLFNHFRITQARHERARRAAALGTDAMTNNLGNSLLSPASTSHHHATGTSGGGLGSGSSKSSASGGQSGKRRVSQGTAATSASAAATATAVPTNASAGSRFASSIGLGLQSSPLNPNSSSSSTSRRQPESNTNGSSFFGMHLSSNSRSTSPSTTKRPPPSSGSTSRVVSKGSFSR